MNYIIYHPKRVITELDGLKIYHDCFGHNEDPYIWNKQFLHSFCHITQISPKEGSLIFWVSGDTYPDFNELNCDCVFVVKEKKYWKNSNDISIDDAIVDNKQTYEHHYKWCHEHYFKKKKRFTLKVDNDKSFQPQDNNQNLINIVPFLNSQGITIEELRNKVSRTKKGKQARNSTPYKLRNEVADRLYDYLSSSDIIIKGEMIENKHPFYQGLSQK